MIPLNPIIIVEIFDV